MRLKIIFLEAVQDFGGARKSTIELASRLSKIHDVQIIDFYGSCKPFIDAANEKNLSTKIVDQRDQPLIIQRSSGKFANFINLLLFIPHWFKIRSAIHKAIKDFKADYVIVNNNKTLSILSFYRGRSFETLFFARGWFLPSQMLKTAKFIHKKNTDKFICVSEATRHAAFCGGMASLDNLFVVHNAIKEDSLSTSVAEIAGDASCFKILHSGGFLPEKGLHVSVEIARILKEHGVNFKLILAGLIYTGPKSLNYYESIVNRIEELKLTQEVLIIKDKPDIIPYFNACDVVIHPSTTEGLPRSIMEAMMLKKPVIANAVGGVTDYILNGFTGYITRFNNPDDYVSYIELLLNDKAKYDSIAANAYALVKKTFTESEQLQQLNKVFNSKHSS